MKTLAAVAACLMVTVLLLCACGPKTPPDSKQKPTSFQTNTPKPTYTPFKEPSAVPEPSVTPAQGYPVTDFLPLADIYLRYTSKLKGPQKDVYVEFIDKNSFSVQRRIVTPSGSTMEILQCIDGKLILTHRTQNIGYTYNFLSSPANESEVLLCEPINVGNQWPIKGGTREITAVNKPVPVPIGSFSCVEVSTTYDNGSRSIQYYMRSVGLLAQYDLDSIGLLQGIYEVSFREKNGGFPQNTHIYFANLEQKTVTGILREVIFSPDIDPCLRFEAELRNVSGASGYIPLSPNVKIRSITVKPSKGVTVDFSRQLITEMDLGPDGEELLLEALARTFAEYYKTDNVFFTVEGRSYSSPYRTIPSNQPISLKK